MLNRTILITPEQFESLSRLADLCGRAMILLDPTPAEALEARIDRLFDVRGEGIVADVEMATRRGLVESYQRVEGEGRPGFHLAGVTMPGGVPVMIGRDGRVYPTRSLADA